MIRSFFRRNGAVARKSAIVPVCTSAARHLPIFPVNRSNGIPLIKSPLHGNWRPAPDGSRGTHAFEPADKIGHLKIIRIFIAAAHGFDVAAVFDVMLVDQQDLMSHSVQSIGSAGQGRNGPFIELRDKCNRSILAQRGFDPFLKMEAVLNRIRADVELAVMERTAERGMSPAGLAHSDRTGSLTALGCTRTADGNRDLLRTAFRIPGDSLLRIALPVPGVRKIGRLPGRSTKREKSRISRSIGSGSADCPGPSGTHAGDSGKRPSLRIREGRADLSENPPVSARKRHSSPHPGTDGERVPAESGRSFAPVPSSVGQDFSDPQRTIRMEHSVHLLRNTELLIDEITLLRGYRSTPFFTEVFRRFYGLPPGAFRLKSKSPGKAPLRETVR